MQDGFGCTKVRWLEARMHTRLPRRHVGGISAHTYKSGQELEQGGIVVAGRQPFVEVLNIWKEVLSRKHRITLYNLLICSPG